MDFKAMQVLCMAVSTLMEEMRWASFGSEQAHTPQVETEEDYHNLDMLMEILGALTRLMDARINYVTNEGKLIRERIEILLEIGSRYKRELEALEALERKGNC
ncbi:MAG: hypothetical protein FJ118_00600 [Deltaproteobacteria bacterium]|nr:hypothetical protein [Deltaproteobacteria bacterium]